MTEEKATANPGKHRSPAIGLLIGGCAVRLWGMSGEERARRALSRAGCGQVIASARYAGNGVPVLAQRADHVIEERLLQALAGTTNTVLSRQKGARRVAVAASFDSQHAPAAIALLGGDVALEGDDAGGLKVVSADAVAGSHDATLRKRAAPYLFELAEDRVAEIEAATFDAAYKGVTDAVTKYLWPRPARAVTRVLARLRITPNMVTLASFLFAVAVFYFFWQGQFAAGLACGWAMAFLDTVDGKLARVTLTSSKWGNLFDHGIDLVAPPLWWLAWWYGLDGAAPGGDMATLAAVLGGHVAGKLLEQAFITTFGLKVHVWQRLDSRFRLFTARRNPNLAILTVAVLLGAPGGGLVVVAVWIMVSLLFHAGRYVRALMARSSGAEIRSWLE